MSDATRAVHAQLMYDAHRKSTGIAYVLWFFLGGLSAHRFYAGKTGSAVFQLLLIIGGWTAIFAGGSVAAFANGANGADVAGSGVAIVGVAMLALVALWLFIDLFLIPGMIRDRNSRLALGLTGGMATY